MSETGAQGGVIVRVFGGMGIDSDDGPVSIGGPRQRRLLALLAMRPATTVSIDWLAEHLWDHEDRPEAAAPALRTYVSRLRSTFPEEAQDWLETEPGGYRFSPPLAAVEHRRFAMLRAEAARAREREDPQTALSLIDEALALWRGDPFRELEDLDWTRGEIEQLVLDRLEMFEERWEAALALGRHTQITGELAAFTAEHGLRDRAARQHALALYRSGRTAEALRVIDDHRSNLVNQSGLDPSVGFLQLEEAIIAGDPSLDVEKIGRPLRGYRLLEEIGTGSFAVVWRAIQPSVDREVAIKQIRSELASQPEFIRRFEAEAHLVARIEHPHIVPLIDYWRDPDSAYLVMRWLRGGTLERRLDDGPLTLDQTLRLAAQIGSALSAAHAQGVVHRDVKTANILCDEHDNAFLSDFGIALEVAKSSGPEAALSPGTPAYASPEQIRQERLGPQADIFSLGVVLFECLTGSLPFPQSSSVKELVELQLHTDYPTLAELRADVPPGVSAAVAKATAKDPADRFVSVDDFLGALQVGVPSPPDGVVRSADWGPPGSGVALPVDGDLANPYKGLRAFDDADGERFFGREILLEEMVRRLAGGGLDSRCLVVVGPSGSGKSSVVRAGLVPAVRSGAVAGSADWFDTTMVPASEPFESLEAALLRIAVNPPPSLLEQLQDGKRGILRCLRRCLGSDDDRVLVVIDQFEELFIGQSSEAATQFLDALSVAVEDPASPLRLVITLRADYYDRPLEHPAFAKLVKATTVQVIPLAGDELERAIVEPARRLGVEFEPGLVASIAAESLGQPSPLPLLQYTLSELFDRRVGRELTSEAYADIGGLSGALAARAEAIHSAADPAQRTAIRRVFGRMTNPSEESADLRRRVPVADLGDDTANEWVLDAFGSARLVTFDRDVGTREPTVEVSHEALLREWPRLVGWLQEDLDVLRSAEAVATAATAWDHAGREATDLYRGGRLEGAVSLALSAPERLRPVDTEFIQVSSAAAEAARGVEARRVRRLRRLVAVVGVALVLALVAGGVAIRQQQRADDEAAAARAASEVAEAQAAAALLATEQAELASLISRSSAVNSDDPDLGLLLALEANRRAPGSETEQAVLNALGSSPIANRLSTLPSIFDRTGSCVTAVAGYDGTLEFSNADGLLIRRDSLTGIVTEHGPMPGDCVNWMGDADTGRRWAGSEDGLTSWFGPFDGPWEVEKTFDTPTWVVSDRLTDNGPMAFVSFPDEIPVVTLHDPSNGEQIGPATTGGDQLTSASFGADGKLVAVSFGTIGRPEGDGKTIVIDGNTGEEVTHFFSSQPAADLAIDVDAGELVAAVFPQIIMTLDIASGEVVSTVEASLTSDVLDIGIRPDGLVVAAASGQVQTIDRRTGPISQPVELRDILFSIVRPDGTLFTVSGSDERGSGVVDPFGSALVPTTWEIDPFVKTAFNDGLAGTVTRSIGNTAEVIDLQTGARTSTELFTKDGDRFLPHSVYPESDGFWALNRDNIFGRWVDGELVEQLELGGDHGTGTRYEDLYAHVSTPADGEQVVNLVDLGDAPGLLFTVPAPDAQNAHVSLEGGLHVFDVDGSLRTYDSAGVLIRAVSTEAEEAGLITMDPSSGKLALTAKLGVVVIVDPLSGQTETLPTIEVVTNFGFASDGAYLVITARDGTVRVWDLVRNESAGLVWEGSGAVGGSPSWYDAETESIWVASSGRLLQIPLNPDRWIERACEIVGRDLTEDEWDRYVPGDEPLESACS